ncbi:hypothetical protein [Kocuria sp. CPCC 205297]|uniref:hypothetical protein n=1 Tax=Kocuria sp. CPCC 205297 TaxID=3073558 RepID=UPI0034D4AFD6
MHENTVELASNAWMLETGKSDSLFSWAPHLALGVLFSEQLGVDTFRISGINLRECEQHRLQDLLACGGIGVEIV